MNLTQRREAAKGAKMRLLRRLFPIFTPPFSLSAPVIPALYAVIPAKAGIQTVAIKPATRNQARIPDSGYPLPFSAPSFPRKRESTGSQSSPPPETKPESQTADTLSLLYLVIPAKAGIHRVAIKPPP